MLLLIPQNHMHFSADGGEQFIAIRTVRTNEVEVAVEKAGYRIELKGKRVIGAIGFEPASTWLCTKRSLDSRVK